MEGAICNTCTLRGCLNWMSSGSLFLLQLYPKALKSVMLNEDSYTSSCINLEYEKIKCVSFLLSALKEAFVDLLLHGFRHCDRQLRNDLLVIASLLAENPAAPMIVSINSYIPKTNNFSFAVIYSVFFHIRVLIFVLLCL